jgi:ABC-type bacteriocin/lantibiotic exporter with double-glycine peptidase domain
MPGLTGLSMHIVQRGARLRMRPYLFLLIISLLLSCGGFPPVGEPGDTYLIENVPFFPQEIYQCGPASLAGVMNYWGAPISPEEIASDIYSPSARGTLTLDMVLYVGKKGLNVSHYQGGVEDLQRKIQSGFPLIVMVDYGFWVYQQNHFMIVFGYNEQGVIAHSGREEEKFISYGDFLKSWKKTEYWTLLITPN